MMLPISSTPVTSLIESSKSQPAVGVDVTPPTSSGALSQI